VQVVLAKYGDAPAAKLGLEIMSDSTRIRAPRAASRPTAQATTGALLKSALRLTGLGCWSWELASGDLAFSTEAERIFGDLGPAPTFARWFACLDAADAAVLQAVEEQVRRGQRSFSFEYRFLRPDGRRRRLKSDGEVVTVDEHGAPLALAGTVLDLGDADLPDPVDARRQDAFELSALFGDSWTWEQDASYRFTSVQGGQRTPIAEIDHALGQRRWELPHAVPLTGTWQDHLLVLEARQPFHGFEYRIGEGPNASYACTSGEPMYDAAGAFRGYRGTAYNITRRVKAEQEAAHAHLLLQQASRLGQLGAWTLAVPEMEVEWTPGSRQLLGDAGDKPLTWEAALACLDPGSRTRLQEAMARCVARKRPFSVEARVMTGDGSNKWLRIIGRPAPSLTGPCRRVIGAIQDVSARKEDARRLQELNQRLVTTLESITEGFFTVDCEWRMTYVNHEMERVARRPRDELLGRSVMDLFPWFRGSRFHQEYERAMTSGRTAQFESVLESLGVWVEVYAYPSAQGLAVYFQDITERKNAEAALRASEERHRLFFEVSLDAVLQLEQASGRILSVNPAACRMFGLGEAEIKARGRDGLIAPGEHRLQALRATAAKEGKARGQVALVRGDGTVFEAEIGGALFTASDGVTYASVSVRDISERLQQEAEILALNLGLTQKVRERTSELEAANKELKDFAHSLAHDLRTPIAAINTLAHVLEQRLQGTEKDRHYAGRIQQAARQLDEYVEALLSHARLSQVPLRASRVDLSAMAERILDDLRLREPQRTVAAHVQPGLVAAGDATLLRMALENLLGNAWKFTGNRDDAQIRFTAQTQAGLPTTYCVSDNGAGFDMDYAHKLFGAFQRLHTQAEFPGTGVGLANVQRIVLRHGGQVWAEGSPGNGASFHFTLQRDE
jgi:PAS domain S-box-containing protein